MEVCYGQTASYKPMDLTAAETGAFPQIMSRFVYKCLPCECNIMLDGAYPYSLDLKSTKSLTNCPQVYIWLQDHIYPHKTKIGSSVASA